MIIVVFFVLDDYGLWYGHKLKSKSKKKRIV
jgi:hypothetical protein